MASDEFFENDYLADVDIAICELSPAGGARADVANAAAAAAPTPIWQGPGHKLVIHKGSEVLAAQLARWSQEAQDSSCENGAGDGMHRQKLVLHVEPGEGPAAVKLLHIMYSGVCKAGRALLQ